MSNSSNAKGQISLEFMALTGFLLIAFVGLVVIVQQRGVEVIKENLQRSQDGVSDIILRELRYGYQAGDGYAREFDLPRTIGGNAYVVEVQSFENASTLSVAYKATTGVGPTVRSVPGRVDDATDAYRSEHGGYPPTVSVMNSGGRILLLLPKYVK